MKTKEFKSLIEELGFITKQYGQDFIIQERNKNDTIAEVNMKEIYEKDTKWDGFSRLNLDTKMKLINVIDEYTATPVVQREEPVYYNLKFKELNNEGGYINYNEINDDVIIGSKESSLVYATEFTQEDIKELPKWINMLINNKIIVKELVKKHVR